MGRLPSHEWDQLLKPPGPNRKRWTARWKKGVDYSLNPQRPLEPHGFAQMIRKWSKVMGLQAKVTTKGDTVTAVLTVVKPPKAG